MNEDLIAFVRAQTGAEIATCAAEEFPPNLGSAATGGLRRISGTTTEGGRWSLFVKTIQSVRHWPLLHTVPEPFRSEWVRKMPWQAEADAYRADLWLPAGLRMPRLYGIVDLGDDRLEIWMEDVQADPSDWSPTRYDRAAELLGRFAAAHPTDIGPTSNLRVYVESRITQVCAPQLQHPDLWTHPLVAPYADTQLREDLQTLAARLPELLDVVDKLPQTFVHGDASPHNLLVDSDGFVAIDWGWYSGHPVGFDLGQLLVGLAHDGLTCPEDLPALQATLEAAYLRGYGPCEQAIQGFRITVALRSAFTAIPVEFLDVPVTPELTELFRRRIGLARFLVDLGLAV